MTRRSPSPAHHCLWLSPSCLGESENRTFEEDGVNFDYCEHTGCVFLYLMETDRKNKAENATAPLSLFLLEQSR